VAWNLNGDAVQIFFDHVYAYVGSNYATANTGSGYGLLVQPNTKYSSGCATYTVYCAPQGIFFHDSSIVAFDYYVDIEQCVQCDIHDDTLDAGAGGPLGSGATIQLGSHALAGGLWITHNYIGTKKPNTYVLYSIASSSGAGINGLWITDNHFLDAVSPGTTIGIAFAGSVPLYQVHINGNTFSTLNEGIVFSQNILDSEVKGNGGSGISTYLINLSGAGGTPSYAGTIIDSNTDTDSISIINEGAATGFVMGFNQSPNQLTGSFIAGGAGCPITPGAIGTACSATITLRNPYANSSYAVTGGAVTGGTGNNTIGSVATLTSGTSFTVDETTLSTSAAGGGVIYCSVVHY
jgi:hypothetical protein